MLEADPISHLVLPENDPVIPQQVMQYLNRRCAARLATLKTAHSVGRESDPSRELLDRNGKGSTGHTALGWCDGHGAASYRSTLVDSTNFKLGGIRTYRV